MTSMTRSLIAPAGLAAALAFLAGPAAATCMLPSTFTAANGHAPALQLPAGWRGPSRHATPDSAAEAGSISGFWKFTFTDTAGNPLDFGYIGMHAGGTETLLSFGRPPLTGDVCMGVWRRSGAYQYKVSHYAPIFDADNVTLIGTLNIIEDLALTPDGGSFSGTLATTGYDTEGNILFQGAGLASATRVTGEQPGALTRRYRSARQLTPDRALWIIGGSSTTGATSGDEA